MAIGIAAAGVGLGAYQAINASKQAKESSQAIKEFNRQDLVNPFENVNISTLGSEQQTDANLSRFATSVDALQRGGTEAVLGGLPKLNEINILLQNRISAEIDQADKNRELLIARGEENIQSIQEGRESLALQGLGQQLQTARQDVASGITNAASSGLAISSAVNNNNSQQAPNNPATPLNLNENTAVNRNSLIVDRTDPLLFPNESPFTTPVNQIDAGLFSNNPLIFNA